MNRLSAPSTRLRLSLLSVLLMVATAAAVSLPHPASADDFDNNPDVTPATQIRRATVGDVSFTTGPILPNDYIWWSIGDPNGCGKLEGAVKATNLPPLAGWNVYAPKADGTCDYSNDINFASPPLISTTQPRVFGSNLSSNVDFAYHSGNNTWTLDYKGADLEAHLTFSNPVLGAAFSTVWDGQYTFWSSSIGTSKVNGTVKFPGQSNFTTITNWNGEEERMAGLFEVWPGHNGYDYAQVHEADGASNQMFVFHNLDGTHRGILARTGVTPSDFNVCEATSINLSNYYSNNDIPGGFDAPEDASSSCSGPLGSVSMNVHSIAHHYMAVPSLNGGDNDNNYFLGPFGMFNGNGVPSFAIVTTNNDACLGNPCLPGTRGNFQHLRDQPFVHDTDGD